MKPIKEQTTVAPQLHDRENWFLLLITNVCYLTALFLGMSLSVFAMSWYMETGEVDHLYALVVGLTVLLLTAVTIFITYKMRLGALKPDIWDNVYIDTYKRSVESTTLLQASVDNLKDRISLIEQEIEL